MSTLIHIGYAKAASTSLQEWFSRHPEMWRFSVATLLKGIPPSKKVCVISDERLSLGIDFDIRNGLILLPKSIKDYQKGTCEQLAELFPNAHILIVTRGFSTFLQSFYSQYVNKGGVLNFPDFIDKYNATLQELLDINYLLGIYNDTFSNRVIVLPFELLRDDKNIFFSILEDKLDLQDFNRPTSKKSNKRINQSQILAYPIFSFHYYSLLNYLGLNGNKKLHKAYVKYILRSWIGEHMANFFSKDVTMHLDLPTEKLSDFVGLASSLINSDYHSNYRSEYLLD